MSHSPLKYGHGYSIKIHVHLDKRMQSSETAGYVVIIVQSSILFFRQFMFVFYLAPKPNNPGIGTHLYSYETGVKILTIIY